MKLIEICSNIKKPAYQKALSLIYRLCLFVYSIFFTLSQELFQSPQYTSHDNRDPDNVSCHFL